MAPVRLSGLAAKCRFAVLAGPVSMMASTTAIERHFADGQCGQMTDEPVRKISPVRAVTPEAIRLAKTLIRHARFGALAVTDPVSRHPNISRVAVAPDLTGAPVILISSLSAHTKALRHDPHCAILLGEPAKGDPLAHPRISVSCVAAFLDRNSPDSDAVAARYLRCNPKSKLYAAFADFSYVRLTPISASLNGGFGQAYNLESADVLSPQFNGQHQFNEAEIIKRLNGQLSKAVAALTAAQIGKPVSKCTVLNFDSEGLDVLTGGLLRRIWLKSPATTQDDLFTFLLKL